MGRMRCVCALSIAAEYCSESPSVAQHNAQSPVAHHASVLLCAALQQLVHLGQVFIPAVACIAIEVSAAAIVVRWHQSHLALRTSICKRPDSLASSSPWRK